MAEWQTYKIKDLGKVVTGKTPPTRDAENFGGVIPFITPSDMDNRKKISSTARSVTEKGLEKVRGSAIPAYSVMVSCIGSDMGKVAINTYDAVTNQQINTIIPNKNFNPDFIYYTLKPRKEELQAYATSGSAQPILNKGHFSELTIDIPPLPEQQAIAGVLSALDEKIELNRRMNATLEAMARALFKSWFVDFDPVKQKMGRAKMEGRTASSPLPLGEGQGEDILSADIAALFPDTLAHSPLGEIPKGWEVVQLDDLLVLQRGFDLPATQRIEGCFPVIAASGISGTHNEAKVSGPGVVTGRSGVLGNVFYIQEDFWPLNTSLWVKEFRECSAVRHFYVLSGVVAPDAGTGARSETPSGFTFRSIRRRYLHHHSEIRT